MKFISWNVNGFRAIKSKGVLDKYISEENPDVFCVQETKMHPEQADIKFDGYHAYWNSAEKKGYSGTAVFAKNEPLSVSYGMNIKEHDNEGRIITLEYEDFYLVNVYTPNSQRGLTRLDYRMVWEDDFKEFLLRLNDEKGVIVCGDLNVAHNEIDLANPSSNRRNAGFTDDEREKFTRLLSGGFVDTFRHLYPDKADEYTWWSYMFKARENNVGWRIDYFLLSRDIIDILDDCVLRQDVMGSDHCPVELTIKSR